ncbi:phosphoethanolamine transferase [Mesonia aestuariivivens]|uniref:Phosphoethanolamine transferase n=1 Tax=Mesonia aestuariivivens TaxID=2796128 RepID=A0ABS6VZ40_9FLAO|nr:phosphoethanolamine transferase [Mesonia aestuariivivens]MBW2960861.1 phosphoethanolamine transferase [Mesonia aestuariivivens]
MPVLFKNKIFTLDSCKSNFVFFNLLPLVVCVSVLKFSGLIVYNLPYIVVKSYFQYTKQIDSIEQFNNNAKTLDVTSTTNNDLLVIVIGESATRQHMSIYGYEKNTTPYLNRLKNTISVYSDVISSQVYTTGSLVDALTLKNRENPYKNETLIPFFKNAGYKVSWLSNQRPVGVHDNMISRLSSTADNKIYLTFNDFRDNTSFDEVLLPLLDDRIKSKEKQVIFIHLSGSHYDYEKRIPKSFKYFGSSGDQHNQKVINAYDNSILYTDYILSEIIKKVDKVNLKSAVVYFSDHGDEVYDTRNFFGHFQNKPTPAMYEIPFLVWTSSTFEKPENFEIDTCRKYMLDDLPHSLTHFFGLKNKFLIEERSVFSKKFEPRLRKVYRGLDYSKFKKQFMYE